MTRRFRLLGFLPLLFFALRGGMHWSQGNPGHMLWMCHVSNVVLAVGLFAANPRLIRLAVIWLLPGIPLWIMDMIVAGFSSPVTFLSHIGGVSVGLVALRVVRADSQTWIYGWVWFLLIQQVSRMITRPELNVNVAHHAYAGWERFFPAYWQYWIFTTLAALPGLRILGWIMMKLFPPTASN